MRSAISALALSAFAAVCSGAPADIWPAKLPALADGAAAGKIDAAAQGLPSALAPAVRFEKAFLSIVAGAPDAEWLPEIRALADQRGDDVVTRAVRDVARAWLARVEMREIGGVLEKYYAENVRFPAALTEVESKVPAGLRTDPWGEKWVYSLHAPHGFARETQQRYQLGPLRYPALGTLREAVATRPRLPDWKVTARAAGGGTALEFRSSAAVLGLIEAGGKIDVYTLLFVGENWALMSSPDQLFTVAF